MLFSKLKGQGAANVVGARQRVARRGHGHTRATALSRARLARSFYVDVLRGREVWDAEAAGACQLSFMIEGTRVDVNTHAATEGAPLALCVGDPDRLAERCWDAGYSVDVRQDSTGTTMSLIDPFGNRIDLVR